MVDTGGTKGDMGGDTGVSDMWGHIKKGTKVVTRGEVWGCMWGHTKGDTGGGMHLRGLQPMDDPCQSTYTLKGTAASGWFTPVQQKQVRRKEQGEEKE